MKKLLTLTLLFASIGFASLSAEAKTDATTTLNTTTTAAEYSAQPGRWRNRQPRVTYRTRYVRVRGRLYRETLQYRYLPNGRVNVRVVSRVRVR
jgi:hypothetical protein